jgi:hypothetical protein
LRGRKSLANLFADDKMSLWWFSVGWFLYLISFRLKNEQNNIRIVHNVPCCRWYKLISVMSLYVILIEKI